MVTAPRSLIPAERVVKAIHVIRGQKVILDADLAALYGVVTRRLNEQVRRNAERFPEDFAFQLTASEFAALMSQSATSKGRGGRRKRPWAFTEHGALAAAYVLNSAAAVRVGLQVVRAFVRIRLLLATNEGVARKVASLDRRVAAHDVELRSISTAFRRLLTADAPPRSRRRIGFQSDEDHRSGESKGRDSSRRRR